MKILALSTSRGDARDEDFKPFLKAEAQRVWELQQADIIREIYFRQDIPDAVLMLECDSIESAKSYLDTLPLVEENLISFELIPLKAYPGFARLFKSE